MYAASTHIYHFVLALSLQTHTVLVLRMRRAPRAAGMSFLKVPIFHYRTIPLVKTHVGRHGP